MILYVIIMFISTITGWVLSLLDNLKQNSLCGLVGGILCVMVPILLIISYYYYEPKAIDVYRNKTTLEITYKDGIPVDSVVVFKDKEK